MFQKKYPIEQVTNESNQKFINRSNQSINQFLISYLLTLLRFIVDTIFFRILTNRTGHLEHPSCCVFFSNLTLNILTKKPLFFDPNSSRKTNVKIEIETEKTALLRVAPQKE